MAANHDSSSERASSILPDRNVAVDDVVTQDPSKSAGRPSLPGVAIPIVKTPFKLNTDPDLSLAVRGPLHVKVGEPLFPPVVVQFVKHNRMERFRLRPPTALIMQPTYDTESSAQELSPESEEYGMLFNTMHRCSSVKVQLLPVGRDGKLFPPKGIIVKDLMNTSAKDKRLYTKGRWIHAGGNSFRFEGDLSAAHTADGAARGVKMKECKEQTELEGTRYHRKGGHHGGAKKGPTAIYAAFPNVRIPCEGQYKIHVVAMDWMGNPTAHLLSDRIITAKEVKLEDFEESKNEPTPDELELLQKLRKNGGFGVFNIE